MERLSEQSCRLAHVIVQYPWRPDGVWVWSSGVRTCLSRVDDDGEPQGDVVDVWEGDKMILLTLSDGDGG